MGSATFKGCNNIPLLDLMLFLWCCIYQSTAPLAIFTSPSTNADIFFFFPGVRSMTESCHPEILVGRSTIFM